MFYKNFGVPVAILLLMSACVGTEDNLEVSLKAPKVRDARVQLSAALDLSNLNDTNFAGRIVIDEIVVNVTSLRLLGENPSIPVAGQALIDEDFILATSANSPRVDFPFPTSMMHEHLAVYARIDSSPHLDNSSVIVRARLLDRPSGEFEQHLTSTRDTNGSTEESTPNPDGEPNREQSPNPDGEPNREESPNPDGEPNREQSPNPDGEPNRGESPNPDGEPNNDDPDDENGSRQSGLSVSESIDGFGSRPLKSISFELRGTDKVEMVVVFDPSSQMNMTLSVPASRWLNESTLSELEQALLQTHGSGKSVESTYTKAKPVIINASNESEDVNAREEQLPKKGKEDYRLVSDDSKGPKRLP